jgi:hypothetical protein
MKNINQKKMVAGLFLVAIICTQSCVKPGSSKPMRYMGTIINSKDSLPLAGKAFKFYQNRSSLSKEMEHIFTTDSKGRFDESVSFSGGLLCWPDYFEGSAYLGMQPVFSIGLIKDSTNAAYIKQFGTVFLQPYP